MITDRLMGNQANEHSEAILPREFHSSYSSAVEFSNSDRIADRLREQQKAPSAAANVHKRLCSIESVASEYSTLVARKGMSSFPNGPSRTTLQSLQVGLLR